MSLEVYHLCNFLEEFEQDRCYVFSKFLVEFSCERKEIPGSVAFVPSVAGLIIAGEVVKDITAAGLS